MNMHVVIIQDYVVYYLQYATVGTLHSQIRLVLKVPQSAVVTVPVCMHLQTVLK